MNEEEKAPWSIKCPICGEGLDAIEGSYAYVYVCEKDGLIILDIKLKIHTDIHTSEYKRV